jgi:hypothetical protein
MEMVVEFFPWEHKRRWHTIPAEFAATCAVTSISRSLDAVKSTCFPTPVIYSMSLYIEYASLNDVHVVRLEFVFMMHTRQIVESVLKFTYLKIMPLARLVGSGRRMGGEGSVFKTRSTSLSLPSEFYAALGKFQVELNCTLKYQMQYCIYQWSALLCGLQQVLVFPFFCNFTQNVWRVAW